MYRALPISRHVGSTSRVIRRRLATDASAAPAKKKGVIRRIFWVTTAATGSFYVGSTFLAFNNQTYYDLFSDHVPLGQSMLEYAEAHGWDNLTIHDIVQTTSNVVISTQRFITEKVNGAPTVSEAVDSVKKTAESKAEGAKAVAVKAIQDVKARAEPVVSQIKTEVKQQTNIFTKKTEALAKNHVEQLSDEISELINKAEAALAGKPYTEDVTATALPEVMPTLDAAPSENAHPSGEEKHIYTVPLPLGFEPPPGFSRPSPSKSAAQPKPAESEPPIPAIPLVAPSVSSLGISEPIISHLAGTIDNLASYLASNPAAAAKATDVLETAKGDLAALAERIEQVKETERLALESKLDMQTQEYTLKLLELEMEAQDKLDSQEEGFRKFFEEERIKFVQAYREKLDNELRAQTELINERLKEEVIAQGIELQRRWIREIKVRVENERGGRLAKLDELSANLKKLERIALDNSSYLDDNIRIHALWSALRAVDSAALSSSVRKPFREELRTLRHIAAAREDPVVSAALDSLEGTDVPDIGVEPFSDLTSWFVREVAPKVSQVALVPDENAGVLSYLASRAISSLRFKRHGMVEGDDVLSVLARAEHLLSENDLDNAARELNQLKGPAKTLIRDWLEAARRRLEVQQALEIVQTQATLASLLVV